MPTGRSGWLPFLTLVLVMGIEAIAGEPRSFLARVVEVESSKPVLNARVRVERFVKPDPTTGWKRVLRVTEHSTDEAGIHRFDLSADELAEPRLGIILHVEHPDHPPTENYFYDLQNALRNQGFGDALSFDTSVEPGSAISGQVVAPDGNPVAGVMVHSFSFFAPDAKPGYLVIGFPDNTRTDDQGRFRFVVRTSGEVELEFYHDKYAVSARKIEDNRRGDLGPFLLGVGQPITGKVVDPDGRPMAGFTVNAKGVREKAQGNPRSGESLGDVSRSTLTVQDGGFAFAPMPPGSYRVVPVELARDPVLGETSRRLPAPFAPTRTTVKPGDAPKPLKIRALATVEVEARFVDSQGRPQSSPTFHLMGRLPVTERRDSPNSMRVPRPDDDDSFWMGEGGSGASGRIVFHAPRGLKDASIYLNHALDERHAYRHRIGRETPLRDDDRIAFEDLDRDFRGVEIVSFESPTVLVRVATLDGSKPKGVRVTAFYPNSKVPEDERQLGDAPRFVEQGDGRYRSQCLLPDEAVAIKVQVDGFPPRTVTLRLPEGAVKELGLTLRK